MEAENGNKALQAKLDELVNLPEGFTFRQAEVWQGLEKKLQRKTKKKRFLWMYAAASVFLFLILLFVFEKPSKHNRKATFNIYTGEKEANKNTSVLKEASTATSLSFNKTITEKKKPVLEVNKKEPVDKDFPVSNETVIENVVKQNMPVVDKQDTSSQITIVPAMVTVQKSKFRIAHINELYKEEPQMPVPQPVKVTIAFTLKKESSSIYDEPINDETSVVQKKGKTFFSLLTSFQ
jgi:hypothetical protein